MSRLGSGRHFKTNYMLTQNDYDSNKTTLKVIRHTTDDLNMNSPLGSFFIILEFILIAVNKIFFNKSGKPKNKLQLIFSIPAIITFVKELLAMINNKAGTKPTTRVKGLSRPQKVAKAIRDGVKRSKKK